jgi:hypothetical protein
MVDHFRNVAHARRTEPLAAPEKRHNRLPRRCVFHAQLDSMRRQADEGAIENDVAMFSDNFEGGEERRLGQSWLEQ